VRISFDMDGVLADMDATLARIAEQEFSVTAKSAPAQAEPDADASPQAGEAPPPYDTALLNALTARQQARLWQRVRDTRNFWEKLDECEPGIVRRLQKLAHELRWDVLFVTQRPGTAGRTQQLQSQHWLRRHGFEYPAVYTTIGSRGAIAAALTLDAHIDDRLQHCMEVDTESKAWPILVWREAESFDRISAGAARLGIAVVRTVGEALDKVEQADRASSQPGQASLLERLRRAFK
jgi:beta-phosphoglucomutase-like phosphatase (HAD superfamily)